MRNEEFMKVITASTVQGNDALLSLSRQSVREARSMKAVTVMALIYVPASFAAVRIQSLMLRSMAAQLQRLTRSSPQEFLQMGYVSVEKGEGFIVSATKGLWIYSAIAVPLVVLTMGAYLCFEIFCRRSRLRGVTSADHRVINAV